MYVLLKETENNQLSIIASTAFCPALVCGHCQKPEGETKTLKPPFTHEATKRQEAAVGYSVIHLDMANNIRSGAC